MDLGTIHIEPASYKGCKTKICPFHTEYSDKVLEKWAEKIKKLGLKIEVVDYGSSRTKEGR